MHYSLLFNILYCLCAYTILFCNGERNIEDYDFIALHSLRGIEEKLNYDDSKQYCETYNGILAVISSKSLNDKAVQQLPHELLKNKLYYIDLRVLKMDVYKWGNGVIYNQNITSNFVLGPSPRFNNKFCINILPSANKFTLRKTWCFKRAQAICLVPPRRSTNTNRKTTTTTTIAITNTAKIIDSKLTMTHQTSNQTKEENKLKRFFIVVLAFLLSFLSFSGLLCFAFYRKKSKKKDLTESKEDNLGYSGLDYSEYTNIDNSN